MARVTVEDCIDKMPNRFELVLVTANRARDLRGGSAIVSDVGSYLGAEQPRREGMVEHAVAGQLGPGLFPLSKHVIGLSSPEQGMKSGNGP